MYSKILNHMKKLFNEGINDDAVLMERTASTLGLDWDEYEDALADCALEVTSGCF
jgi:predicted DsbA family dithiol-disulfide isomerase